MLQVFIYCWYQEYPDHLQKEVLFQSKDNQECWEYLNKNYQKISENYPIHTIGIRISDINNQENDMIRFDYEKN